jgi:acyl-CoA hydrolase
VGGVGVMRLFRNGFLGSTKSTIWQTFRGFSSSGIHQETELSGVENGKRQEREIQRYGTTSRVSEPFYAIPGREPKVVSADEAVTVVKSGDNVFVQGVAATPTPLLEALCRWAKKANLKKVRLHHIHTEGPLPHLKPEFEGVFRDNSLFMGANVREAVNAGKADYTPVFLSEIPSLFRSGAIPLDVAFVHTTPPDNHGYVSLGTSVDCTRAALEMAKHKVAIVNPRMPYTFGDSFVHISQLDYLVQEEFELFQLEAKPPNAVQERIGRWIATHLVEDGACLQMGIGAIPNAVLSKLRNHKDLGVHTEMFSDGLIDLVECGAVTNSKKAINPGRIVSGFLLGTRKLYDFVDRNPLVTMHDIAFTNNPVVIAKNSKVTAINSAIEVDLTGQVVSDSIGTKLYSGVGGQVDFIRGASLSQGGKPIIALPSTTSSGISRIVNFAHPGGGVVTTRAHVYYVVTEWGICELHGKNLRERALALISVAHPDHREALEKAAFERGLLNQ